jgi:predicted GIY-YIG superfamily endonuclease
MSHINISFELIEMFENEPRISHRVLAKKTDNKILSVQKLITENIEELKLFGEVKFKIEAKSNENRGGDKPTTYYLNEAQLSFLFLISKISIKLSSLFVKYRNSFIAIEEYSKIKTNIETLFVYIIQFDNGNLKIGFSSNPTKRLRTLETQSGNLITKRLLLQFNSKKEALAKEKKLHQQFSEFRTHGEYFNIDFDEVIKQIQQNIGSKRLSD